MTTFLQFPPNAGIPEIETYFSSVWLLSQILVPDTKSLEIIGIQPEERNEGVFWSQ